MPTDSELVGQLVEPMAKAAMMAIPPGLVIFDGGYEGVPITVTRNSVKHLMGPAGILQTIPINAQPHHWEPGGAYLGRLIEWAATNILWDSFNPATQSRTISNATEYTIQMRGSGSVVLSNGLAGTVTEGSPVTVTSTTTTGTFTISGDVTEFQCETGDTATSLILTPGGSGAARAADVVTSGVDWLDAIDGTIFVELIRAADPTPNVWLVNLSDGSAANNRVSLNMAAAFNGPRFQIKDGGVTQVDLSANHNWIASGNVKMALAYAANDFAGTSQGNAPATDVSGSVPTAITQMDIGGRPGLSGEEANCHFKNITDWPRLNNTQIQALTA
jgi:hypothetical protein